MLVTRAPTRSNSTAGAALAWAGVFICALYAGFALIMAIAAVLDWLASGGHGTGRSAPPLFVLHALSGAVALVAGSLQLRLATRLLRGRRALHRRIGQTYLWAAWITSLSSLGVAAFFDVTIAAKAMFATTSLLWFATTTVGFLRIRQGRVRQHREWMLRSFALALFFVTGSLWPPILAATALPQAIGYPLALFLSWSLNLLAAEWWIRRTKPNARQSLPAGPDPSPRRTAPRPAASSTADLHTGGSRPPPRQGCAPCCARWVPSSLGLAAGWRSRRPRSLPAWRPSASATTTCCATWPPSRWPWGRPLLAATRPTWRVPVLAITLFQFTLHTLNHLLDIGHVEPGWLGPANALALGLASVALALPLHPASNPPPGRPIRPGRKRSSHDELCAGGSG
jgi:Predicted membrane protein (DUF2306)